MSDRLAVPGSTRPPWRRRGRRTAQRALAVLAALAMLTTLAACQDMAETTSPPARPAPTAKLERADVNAWLDGMLPAALKRVGIAGAGVAVVNEGGVLTSRGYGWADTGSDDGDRSPVDPAHSLFRLGSVSKVVTATAVMQLVEHGQLDLDTDVRTYLDFDLPLTKGPVTLRQLLTHTAGFEDRAAGLIRLDGAPVDLRRAVSTDPPAQAYLPGTVPAYSNYGNALAGYVVERVSRVRFADYVRDFVLKPAGMTSSSFEQPLPPGLAGQMSRGYPDNASPAAPFEHIEESPAGGLSATTDDMAAFMLAQLGEPQTGRSVLSQESLELLQSPALDAGTLGTLAEGPRMCLGFFDESRNGQRILGHGGDTQFFHSHLQIYPDQGVGIFISLNSSGTGPLDTIDLRDALMQGFTDRYFPGPAAQTSASIDPAQSTERARTAAGTYRSSRSMQSSFLSVLDLSATTRVRARPDGRLLVEPAQGLPSVFYQEVAPWVWREVGGQRMLTIRTADGEVTAIGTGPASTLLPVGAGRRPGVAVPVLLLSSALLLGAVVGWGAAAVLRRRSPRPAAARSAKVARRLTQAGTGLTLSALAGWLLVLQALVALQQVPFPILRLLQAVQLLGALAVVPAVVAVVQSVRSGAGRWRTLAWLLVLLALVGTAWFALVFRLLAPSVSY